MVPAHRTAIAAVFLATPVAPVVADRLLVMIDHRVSPRLMSLKLKAIQGTLLLTLGEGVIYGCSFIRNMILARMLTKADFGIAATFALIMTLLEMSDKLGMARFVVRDKEGNEPEFIAAAHVVHFVAAALSAILIVACAGPLSILFGIPDQRWAIFLLALGPLFRGVEHLDVRRFERDLRFAPSLLVEALPQVVITLAAWPVVSWLGDYRAVLLLLLAKGLVSCVGSHLLAERPYRWRMHRVYIRRMLRFGWPLVVNGFLMFGVLQGDHFLIAALYTMTDLAPYAAAAALTMAPTFFFGRVFNSLMLPIVADVQGDPVALARRYRQVLSVVTVFAVVCSVAMILGGEAFMRLVYGSKYAGAGVLLAWLAAANAFRNVRIAPAVAAIAKGDSQNQMISNLFRVVALIPAAAVAFAQKPLWLIACTGLLGEALACWISFLRLRRRDSVPLSNSLVPASWVLLAVATSGALVLVGFHRLPPGLSVSLAAFGACVGAIATIAALPELRSEAGKLYAHWRLAGWRGCMKDLRQTTSQARIVAS
jgi:O-antigen/teichoic acid export membrane protein